MTKKEKIIKDLENVGYIKVDNDTWQYAKVGIKITFLKEDVVKISIGSMKIFIVIASRTVIGDLKGS